MKTIIIAGGTGFLGKVLEQFFISKNYKVYILTRQPKKENDVFWDAKTLGKWTAYLENSEALINLTGKSVDCRYTEKNKKTIYNSRMDSTAVLGLAINLCEQPPKAWFNSSTATIYKHSTNKEMSETNGEIGNDFSMNIAKSWEKTFFNITNPKTRKIALRTSIVLGKKGGALMPLKTLILLGLGGNQGSGTQKVSWIHEQDFANAVYFLLKNKTLNGVFNLAVPKPTNNKTLMHAFRQSLGIPFGISHPEWLLKLGAKLIGTETELVLKSRNVIPERLLQNGFVFKYTTINNAVKSLLK